MKISDKELDDLFHSKLNDLEVEPGETVWNNIAGEININKNKKKSIIPFLKIAASIIIVISAGLLLLKKEDAPVKKTVQNKVTKVQIKQQKPVTEQIKNTKSDEPILLLSAKNKVVKEARQNKISIKKRVVIPVPNLTLKLKVADEMLAATDQPEKKNAPNVTTLMVARAAVVPDVSTQFNIKTDEEETVAETVKPQNLPAKNSMPAVPVKRKGIRNMGDLINLVMAKVDKRQDKLIEFTNCDDGDESTVTGINLGIITIKKEK